MRKYQDIVVNQGGQPVANVQVTVLVNGTSTLASLFSDDAGGTPTTNPVTTGADGLFNFYVPDGRYTLAVSGTGIASTQQTDIEIVDLVGSTNPIDLPWKVLVVDVPNSSAPAVSTSGTGRIYFDTGAAKFRVSENGTSFANAFGGGGGSHPLLDGSTDNDTVLVSPVKGDLVYANPSGKWDRLPGNTTTNRWFLVSQGTGAAAQTPQYQQIVLGDIPAGVEQTSNKNVASGYCGLQSNQRVDPTNLGTGTPNSTVFLRGDGSWATPSSSSSTFTPVVALDTSTHTVANTVTETNMATCVFAAGDTNVVGRQYRIRAGGFFSTTGTPTLQFKVLIQSVVTLGVAKVFTTPTGASTNAWWIDGVITRVTTGATGTTFFHGTFYMNGNTVGTAQVELQGTTAGQTWDATVSQTLTVSMKWGTASASNTVTQNFFQVVRENN